MFGFGVNTPRWLPKWHEVFFLVKPNQTQPIAMQNQSKEDVYSSDTQVKTPLTGRFSKDKSLTRKLRRQGPDEVLRELRCFGVFDLMHASVVESTRQSLLNVPNNRIQNVHRSSRQQGQ